MMDVRFAQRRARVRRERRHVRLRRTLTVLGIVAVLVVLWVIERSPLVALDNIVIEGNAAVTDDEILAAADLERGTSTLRLGLGDATERVRALPAIAEAHIARVDAVTVRIKVVERVAELRLHTPTAKWLVDRGGVVFAPGPGPPTMPIVLTEHEVALGDTAMEAGLVDVVAVHAGLSGPLRARVAAYRVESGNQVELLLEGDLVVRLGDASRLDEKIRAVGALLEEIEGSGAAQIDVRVPSRPVVTAP